MKPESLAPRACVELETASKAMSGKRTKRVVVVRRARQGDGVLAAGNKPSPGRKKRVVVARPPRPGEQLHGTKVEPVGTETFRYDSQGELIPHSYLGAEEEEEQAEAEALLEAEAAQQRTSGSAGSMGGGVGHGLGRGNGGTAAFERGASSRSFLTRSVAGSRRSLMEAEPPQPVDPVAARMSAANETLTNARKSRVKSEKERRNVLKGLAIHERTALMKEERARKRWEQQQRCVCGGCVCVCVCVCECGGFAHVGLRMCCCVRACGYVLLVAGVFCCCCCLLCCYASACCGASDDTHCSSCVVCLSLWLVRRAACDQFGCVHPFLIAGSGNVSNHPWLVAWAATRANSWSVTPRSTARWWRSTT